jgi:ribosome recycling factor
MEEELSSIRSGRVMPSMLEGTEVEAYGSTTPLNQVGKVGVVDSSTLVIRLWDSGIVDDVMKVLRKDERGFSLRNDGNNIYVSPPSLTDEVKAEYIKEVKSIGEDAYQKLRDVRNEMRSWVKELLDEKKIGEEKQHMLEEEIEDLTKEMKKKIEDRIDQKLEKLK